jgi:hypothetical protein
MKWQDVGACSPLLEGVSRALEVLGVPHSVSWRTPDGLLAVDVLVPRQAPHPPLALLVDGPWHFRALPPYEPLGRSELRNRLLAARGYGVLVIPGLTGTRLSAKGVMLVCSSCRLSCSLQVSWLTSVLPKFLEML